jgi:hypothetical protein
MIVIVNVKGHLVEINLGSGSQTFKWLGQVVTYKLKTHHILRSSFQEECRHVVNFRTSGGAIINPNDSICATVGDREVVHAEVVDTLPSGPNTHIFSLSHIIVFKLRQRR